MDSSPSSPAAISSTPRKLSGIPFSWEKLPGIPKKPSPYQIPTAAPSSKTSLPPPPPSTTTTPKKHSKKADQSSEWDPFVSALVQCSRDHDGGQSQRYRDDDEKGQKGGGGGVWTVSKVPRRSIGDLLGFRVSLNGYGSCKVSSAVSDSIVYVPAGLRRRGDYGLVSDRRHR